MLNFNAIVQNQRPETLQLCQEVSQEIGIRLTLARNLADFLLQLQENDLHLAIFEFDSFAAEQIGWARLIRKMRPKIPLIIICDAPERETAAQLYDLGIFYVGIRPIHRVLLSEIFLAAIKCYLT
jgi:DNA-binding NtrC family response regulator